MGPSVCEAAPTLLFHDVFKHDDHPVLVKHEVDLIRAFDGTGAAGWGCGWPVVRRVRVWRVWSVCVGWCTLDVLVEGVDAAWARIWPRVFVVAVSRGAKWGP